jgi:hypothetical protein
LLSAANQNILELRENFIETTLGKAEALKITTLNK